MKWHSIHITIAASLLITLPWQVNSAHCDEKSWNRVLKLQHDLEQVYNHHATRFNEFLQIHQAQPFLYQQFTQDELQALWQSRNNRFQEQIQSQADASQEVVKRIKEERVLLEPMLAKAETQQSHWLDLSKHCKRTGNQTNVIASTNYSQLNRALKADIEALLSKLKVLESRYERERLAIESAKPNQASP